MLDVFIIVREIGNSIEVKVKPIEEVLDCAINHDAMIETELDVEKIIETEE